MLSMSVFKRIKYFYLFLFVFLSFSQNDVEAETWPVLRNFEMTVGVSFDTERLLLSIPFYDVEGVAQYWLKCDGGTTSYLDEISEMSGVQYVGPFNCRLDIEDRRYSGRSVLGRGNWGGVWQTRGHFSSAQLIGVCGNYPEYGRLRHFRLRGFELKLEVIEPIVIDDRVSYFDFKITAASNDKITSSRPEASGYLNPKGDCEEIKEGADPGFCRDMENLLAIPCKDYYKE